MNEITFIVHEADEGGYYTESVGVGIFAEGETIDELKENIKGGIDCYFTDTESKPAIINFSLSQNTSFLNFRDK